MKTDAPNFSGNYPGGGERIGPAWQIMWDTLADHRPRQATPLAELVAHLIKDKTARNLLRQAAKAGLLSQSMVQGKRSAWTAVYRRK